MIFEYVFADDKTWVGVYKETDGLSEAACYSNMKVFDLFSLMWVFVYAISFVFVYPVPNP